MDLLHSEVFITEGMHQNQHGSIVAIHASTTIPFASIQLRGVSGQLLATRFALVPMKYCRPVDDDVRALIRQLKKVKKAARLANLERERAADAAFIHAFARAQATFDKPEQICPD
jgi:hypothetical protein